MSEKNGTFVKWGTVITIIPMVIYLVLNLSTKNISKDEFIQFEKKIEVQFGAINQNIDFLREDIRAMKK